MLSEPPSPPRVPRPAPPGEPDAALDALECLGANTPARLRPQGHLPVDAHRPDGLLCAGRSRRRDQLGARPGASAQAVPTPAAPVPQRSAPAGASDNPLDPLLPAPLRPPRGRGS